MTKELLRSRAKELRMAQSKNQVLEKSAAMCDIIIKSELFKNAKMVALYMPIQNEIDPSGVLEAALSLGKKVFAAFDPIIIYNLLLIYSNSFLIHLL